MASKPTKKAPGRKAAPERPRIPAAFRKEAKARFEATNFREETDFTTFVRRQFEGSLRLEALAQGTAVGYTPRPGSITPCGNGDFAERLDPTEWQGASGSIDSRIIPPIPLIEGIVAGPISSATSHHTWVGPGQDPIVSALSTTAPNSTGAVRIGNAVSGYGIELLSKTFVVTPTLANISFWYAVVMQNPVDHDLDVQPSFSVLVKDSNSGTIIPGAFDFGAGGTPAYTLPADVNNPFFSIVPMGSNPIVWKDWACAQIDLSSMVGRMVTLEFVNQDCGYGGHWGYTYIDRFCGDCEGSPTGTISYNCDASDHCGEGKICFDYTLPEVTISPDGTPTTQTGEVAITLDIMQNGSVVHTLASGTLTSGSGFCFDVDPLTIPGIVPGLGGFDFRAEGTFSITTSAGTFGLGTRKIGRAPDGIILGTNNDYQLRCRTCAEVQEDHRAAVTQRCSGKKNTLQRFDCHCPDGSWVPDEGSAGGCCDGSGSSDGGAARGPGRIGEGLDPNDLPDPIADPPDAMEPDQSDEPGAAIPIEPCKEFDPGCVGPDITVRWGDSDCDCLETDDVETLCITVCNHFENVTFAKLTIGQILVTEMDGTPVPVLPDGTPSVQIIPGGAVCFGDLGPCVAGVPSCATQEVVLYTRGAKGKDYRVTFDGVCYTLQHSATAKACYVLPLCQD